MSALSSIPAVGTRNATPGPLPSNSPATPSTLVKAKQVFAGILPLITSITYIGWTDTQIKQAFLCFFSSYALIGTKAIAKSFFSAFVVAHPFVFLSGVLLSGALLWHALSLVDCDHPKTIAEILTDLENLALRALMKKQELIHLFRHKLVDNTAFQAVYREYAKTLSFNQVLDLHKKASEALNKIADPRSPYSIHALSEQIFTFLQEAQKIFKEILKSGPMERFKTLEILTPEQTVIFNRWYNLFSKQGMIK